MALKLPNSFPIFAPTLPNLYPNSDGTVRRPPTEIRFSRWNNANADKFNQRQRAQQVIEDDIRRYRRFDSATKIATTIDSSSATPPPETYKSIGSPSSPSRPSIPGKKSKYSKPPNHPAFRKFSKTANPPPPTPFDKKPANVAVGEDGVSFVIDGAPFEFKYSYTETPKVKPIKLREPPYSPFGPTTMGRPWTGRAPLPPSKKKMKEFDSFVLPPPNKKGVKPIQKPGPYLPGTGPRYVQSREEILGEPLTAEEVKELVNSCLKTQRQLNIGRDGLTHNMLDNIHAHWKRRRVCKIKCKGVCTVDMNNVCEQLEELVPCVLISFEDEQILMWRGRNWKSSFPKPAFNSGGDKSDAASATSFTEQLEGQELSPPYVQTASTCPPLTSSQDISIEQRESSVAKDRTNAALDAMPATMETIEETLERIDYAIDDSESKGNTSENATVFSDMKCVDDESETMSKTYGPESILDTSGIVNEEPVAMQLESDIMPRSPESTLSQSVYSVMDSLNHDKLEVVAEASQAINGSPRMTAPCTERVLLLMKQAVESGSAVVLDDATLDADRIYERAVAFAQSAPPGPVFRRQPRKVAVQKNEKQEPGDLEVKEATAVPYKRGKEKQPSKTQRIKDIDEHPLDVVPHGSLRVDELAKLLA
ncbi:hypothetical protein REPUB_Repub03eG0077600 [Reevesia pubescens]